MRKRRTVVIEDEEFIIDLFKDFFSTRGYEVLAYTTAVVCPFPDENENRCNMDHPCADVIITDFSMSGMNGYEQLLEQSRRGCKLSRENKAVLSGYLSDEIRREITQLGYAFFQKPIDWLEIGKWLEECEKRIDLSQPLASRRKEKRHITHYDVHCLVNGTGEIVDGITEDISESGLCLKLRIPLAANETIHIITNHAITACATAAVRWVSRNPDGSYMTGLSCQ